MGKDWEDLIALSNKQMPEICESCSKHRETYSMLFQSLSKQIIIQNPEILVFQHSYQT